MVTASTFRKERLFAAPERLSLLQRTLSAAADRHRWRLEAWAVFSNHYHFIAASPLDPSTLPKLIRELHSRTSIAVNREDHSPGRKVWHNSWDMLITSERSYFARLNYVHQNPVRHGLVPVASQYHYGSAAWFERTATHAQVQTIYSFKIDQVSVPDDF